MQKWQAQLRELEQVLSGDPSQVEGLLRSIDEVVSSGFEQNFMNQVDHKGSTWPERVDNLPHPLLRKTGRMFAAATDPDDPGHILDSDRDGNVSITIDESEVPYWTFHHTGTHKMPARRFLYASQQTVGLLFEAVEDSYYRELDRRQLI